jgi:hypothetical protein
MRADCSREGDSLKYILSRDASLDQMRFLRTSRWRAGFRNSDYAYCARRELVKMEDSGTSFEWGMD